MMPQNRWDQIVELSRLKTENDQLKAEMAELERKYADLARFAQENAR